MIGIIVAFLTLAALVLYASGWWRPKWIRQEEITETVDRTYTAEVLDMQCALLTSVIPEKDRIRHVADVA